MDDLDILRAELDAADMAWLRGTAVAGPSGELVLHSLEVVTGGEPQGWEAIAWYYRTCLFVAEQFSGQEMLGILNGQPLRMAGHEVSIDFDLSPTRLGRRPSRAGGHHSAPLMWPAEEWNLPHRRAGNLPSGPLVAQGCPSFPHFMTAWADLFGIGGRLPVQPQPGANFSFQDRSGRIDSVRVGADSVVIGLDGEDLGNLRIDLQGAGYRTSVPVNGEDSVNVALPGGIVPAGAWVALARGDEWLDQRTFDPRFPRRQEPGVEWSTDEPASLLGAILGGESSTVEFKGEFSREQKSRMHFACTTAAFANGDGGRIVVGVTKIAQLVGIKDHPETLRDAITNFVRDKVQPLPDFEVAIRQVEGLTVLVVEVQPGSQRPYGVRFGGTDWRCYLRRAGTTFPADRDGLLSLPSPPQGGSIQALL